MKSLNLNEKVYSVGDLRKIINTTREKMRECIQFGYKKQDKIELKAWSEFVISNIEAGIYLDDAKPNKKAKNKSKIKNRRIKKQNL